MIPEIAAPVHSAAAATSGRDAAAAGSAACSICLQTQARVDGLERLLKSLVGKAQSIEKSMEFWDSTMEEKVKLMDGAVREVEQLKKDVTSDRGSPESVLARDVIVPGIPEASGEKTAEVGRCIVGELIPELTPDVVSAMRLPASDRAPGLIKMSLKTSSARNRLLKAARVKRLNVRDLKLEEKISVLSSDDAPTWKCPLQLSILGSRGLFVNESLSKPTRVLLSKSRALKRSGVVHSVWTNSDRVFIRASAESPPTMIMSDRDLPVERVPGLEAASHPEDQFETSEHNTALIIGDDV